MNDRIIFACLLLATACSKDRIFDPVPVTGGSGGVESGGVAGSPERGGTGGIAGSNSGNSDASMSGGVGGSGGTGAITDAGMNVCAAGDRICDNNVVMSCSEDGSAYEPIKNCGNDQCVLGVCEDSLLAYWTFDEGTGITTVDVTPNAYSGVVTAADWVEGHSGSALAFNGATTEVTWVDLGDILNTELKYPYSLSAWVKLPEEAERGTLFHSDPDLKYCGVLWRMSRTEMRLFAGSCGGVLNVDNRRQKTVSFSPALTPNRWYHVAAVGAGADEYHLYLDGAEVAPDGEMIGNYVGQIAHNSAPAYIGYGDLSGGSVHIPEPFYGTIDEFRIYGRALSPAEVQNLAN